MSTEVGHHGKVVESTSLGGRRWTCCGKPEATADCSVDARPRASRATNEGGELVWDRCEARGCWQRTLVHPSSRPAKVYCGPSCAAAGAADAALYERGARLRHLRTCPGCAGSGVEDNTRWGADLQLCTWYPTAEPDTYERGVRCGCQEHLMNAKFERGVEVVELDEHGGKHGFERCGSIRPSILLSPTEADTVERLLNDPPEPTPALRAAMASCWVPPPGWYCTRGSGHEGPCAAWPDTKQVGQLAREFLGIAAISLASFAAGFYTVWCFLR